MATSKIKRPGVQTLGSATKEAYASAFQNASASNLVQLAVKSDYGYYVLQTSNTGIELRDASTNTLIHRVNWTT